MILHWMSRKLRRYIFIVLCVLIIILIRTTLKHHGNNVIQKKGQFLQSSRIAKSQEKHQPSFPRKWLIAFANDSHVCYPLVTHFHNFNVLVSGTQNENVRHGRCFFLGKANISSMCKEDVCDRSFQIRFSVLFLQQYQPKSILLIARLDMTNLQHYDLLHTQPESNISMFYEGSTVFYPLSYYGCNISVDIKETAKPDVKYKLCSFQESAIQAYAFVSGAAYFTCDNTMPPLVLGNNQYPDFYQDNIYITSDAIWAFGFLPLNCVTRECFLLQSVVQRLLRLSSNTVRLVNVESRQSNNLTNSVYSEEVLKPNKVYLSLINTWNCSRINFRDCIIDFVTYLKTKAILTDISYIVKWVNDLVKTKYKFPLLQEINVNQDCKANRIHLVPVNYSLPPPEMLTWRKVKTPINTIKASQKLYNSLCSEESSAAVKLNQPWVQFDDILLIVVFNNPHYEAIPYIDLLYASFFPHILYCGSEYPKQSEFPYLFNSADDSFSRNFITYGSTPEGHTKGAFSYTCLQIATAMNFKLKGYLVIADDSIIWLHKLSKFPKDVVWFLPQREIRIGELRTLRECKLGMCDFFPHWNWWEDYQQPTMNVLHQMKAMKDKSSLIYECYSQLVELNGAEFRANGAYSDIFYVPQRLANNFAILSELFLESKVFLEIAIPTILRCIERPENIQSLEGVQNWDVYTRNEPWKYFSPKYIIKQVYYHPVKWSFINKGNNTKEYQSYLCNKVLPFLFDPYERLH